MAVGMGLKVGEPRGALVGAEDGFNMVFTKMLPVVDPAYSVVTQCR